MMWEDESQKENYIKECLSRVRLATEQLQKLEQAFRLTSSSLKDSLRDIETGLQEEKFSLVVGRLSSDTTAKEL